MINNKNIFSNKQEAFLDFVANKISMKEVRLPPLSIISQQLGISVSSLREQVELARFLGLIETRPKVGITLKPYDFKSSLIRSLAFAVALNKDYFEKFNDLRTHLEKVYFLEAVELLDEEDIFQMRQIIGSARQKLNGNPIQIPHKEHEKLHLLIYSKLENEFVLGLFETYWMLYEEVGLALYSNLTYLLNVWAYHEKIVESIADKQYDVGFKCLVDHMNLINERI